VIRSIENYAATVRLFGHDAWMSILTQASLGFCYYGLYAVLFNLYVLRLGYDLQFVSLINAAGQLGFAISSGLTGAISRRWGNRRMIVVGMVLNLTCPALLAVVRFQATDLQAIWLLATYSLSWIGLAVVIVNIIPYMVAASTSQERNHLFAVVGAILPLSGFLGSLFSGLLPGLFSRTLVVSLAQPEPYRYPLLLAAVFMVPGFAAMLATRSPVNGDQNSQLGESQKTPAPLALIALLTLVMLLVRMGEGAARMFFNAYLDTALNVPVAVIASLAAVGQLIAVPAALSAPVLESRFGLRRTVALGSMALAFVLLPLALIARWQAAGLSLIGVMALVSITVPAFGVYHQTVVITRWRTAMSGATTMALGLSWSIIALLGGFMITQSGYNQFFLIGVFFTALGAMLFLLFAPHKKAIEPETTVTGALELARE
jgi:MFS family permease